jgi:hypothetical protein
LCCFFIHGLIILAMQRSANAWFDPAVAVTAFLYFLVASVENAEMRMHWKGLPRVIWNGDDGKAGRVVP